MQNVMRNLVAMLAVLALIAGCASPPATDAGKSGSTEIWWLGQSAMRITTPGGKVIMVDPWILGNPKTPAQYKSLDALGKLDLILVTHAHGDHMGDAVALAKKNNVPVWAPAGLNQLWQTLGELSPELSPRMNKSGTISPFPGVKITQVHAEHSSEILWTNPVTKKQETLFGGEPVGFIIELENGFKIYHMGDTGLFGDMKMIGEYYAPDLIMIPIGGHYVMSPRDAAKATKEYLQPKYAIPMHYATNPFLVGTPQEYMDALGNFPVKVFPINPGDKLRF
jgi:L-ascorbate metabolism protein UlaG (beta-lactamase superfamily)